MTKIGNEQVKPISRQANIPPAIDSSLQGTPGSQASMEEKSKEEGSVSTTSQPAETSQPASTTSATPDHKADLIGYDTQINILKRAREAYAKANETEEERKKREKREKSKRIIAAVGDGIRALSNLYFTSQYAPNMYNPNDSQLAKEDARQEKLKAEREANRDKYLNYSLRIGNLENERTSALREMEERAERLRLAREKGKREQEEHQWLADVQPDKKRKVKGEADAAESVAKTRKAEADNAEAFYKERVQHEQAKTQTEQQRGKTEQTKQALNIAGVGAKRASAVASYAAARAHDRSNRGGSGGSTGTSGKKGGYTIKLKDGSVHTYGTEQIGALTSLAPTMAKKARAAAERYMKTGNREAAKHYRAIADKIEKAGGGKAAAGIVAANVWDFPSMDADVRKMIGTKAAADDFAKRNGTFHAENKTEKTTTISKARGRTTSQISTKTSSSGGYSQSPKKRFSSFSIHK